VNRINLKSDILWIGKLLIIISLSLSLKNYIFFSKMYDLQISSNENIEEVFILPILIHKITSSVLIVMIKFVRNI